MEWHLPGQPWPLCKTPSQLGTKLILFLKETAFRENSRIDIKQDNSITTHSWFSALPRQPSLLKPVLSFPICHNSIRWWWFTCSFSSSSTPCPWPPESRRIGLLSNSWRKAEALYKIFPPLSTLINVPVPTETLGWVQPISRDSRLWRMPPQTASSTCWTRSPVVLAGQMVWSPASQAQCLALWTALSSLNVCLLSSDSLLATLRTPSRSHILFLLSRETIT